MLIFVDLTMEKSFCTTHRYWKYYGCVVEHNFLQQEFSGIRDLQTVLLP